MSAPAVSLVMSVYNGEQHLRESLESILAQSFGDFEFIIVNDGSIDGSRDILAEFERQDRRIRVIDQENRGLTLALIRGCREAQGEYIARQDADDWSHPERFRQSVEYLDNRSDVVMVSSWAKSIDPVGDEVETIERPIDPETATHQLVHERIGPPAHGSVMFRREAYEILGGYRDCFYYAQDSDLWLRMAGLGLMAYLPEYLYHWRVSPETISGMNGQVQWQFGELGQRCHAARLAGVNETPLLEQAKSLRAEVLGRKGNCSPVRRSRAAANYRLGTSLSRRHNPRAKGYFWSAVRLNPLHWRGWFRLCFELLRPVRGSKGRSDLSSRVVQ